MTAPNELIEVLKDIAKYLEHIALILAVGGFTLVLYLFKKR